MVHPGAQEKGDRKGRNAEWGWGRLWKNSALAGREQREHILTVNRPVCDLTGGSHVAEPAGFPTSATLQFSGRREGQLAGRAQPGHGAKRVEKPGRHRRAATGAGETGGNRGMSLRKRKTFFFFPTFSIRRVQGANMEKLKIKPEFTAEPQN